ncbi:MAG: tRNA lysidine(34) synthetase TilS [Ruminococcus sp.]|nr:tRNA lysidine(34) synthetase TilS [Ruminococcus sp.]
MITDKIFDLISSENMLTPGDCVVCGLSGGADSVCLLLAMNSLAGRLGISVEALHVNHCLRGSESDRDEAFCRELCSRLGIPYTAVSCDVTGLSEKESLSTEEAARKLRYGIFAEHSQGKKLATAHNADDNLETMILNLARGTALKGLAGIPAVRGNIIRPLLAVSRSEIEAYLDMLGQEYVTDSTNLSDDYTRNKIRHRIVPLLNEINPSAVLTAARSAAALREENSFIEVETEHAEKACRSGNTFTGLAAYPSVIRKRCTARLLSDNSVPYSYDRLCTADGIIVKGGKLNVSGELYLVSDGRVFSLELLTAAAEMPEVSAELVPGKNIIFPGKALVCEIRKCDNLKKSERVNKILTYYELDYDKIIGRAFVRNRRKGDRIRLAGRDFTSSVKKLINEKIPVSSRPFLHFIEDEDGTVFAEGLGIADRVKPGADTRRIMTINIINI